jgi:hypothetical protein
MIIIISGERHHRTTDDFDAMRMGPRRDLCVSRRNLRYHRGVLDGAGGGIARQDAEIVDSAYAAARDHVAVEPREQVRAQAVEQHPVAADPCIDHAERPGRRGPAQPCRENVGQRVLWSDGTP